MIFITVGTQAPFNRLIKLVDEWAAHSNEAIFAQIANGAYIPKNFPSKQYLDEEEFMNIFNKSSIIISHAGMGTIISCLENEKVILTLPRQHKYREHRNDHQVYTTQSLSQKGYIYPIFTDEDLLSYLEKLKELRSLNAEIASTRTELIDFIKNI